MDTIIERFEILEAGRLHEDPLTCELESELKFPKAQSVDGFKEFVGQMDKVLKKHVIKELSKVGGKRLQDMISRIFERTATSEVWCQFSYHGRRGKQPLKNLPVLRCFIKAIRIIHPSASDADIEEEIGKFLKHTPSRQGGYLCEMPRAQLRRRRTASQSNSAGGEDSGGVSNGSNYTHHPRKRHCRHLDPLDAPAAARPDCIIQLKGRRKPYKRRSGTSTPKEQDSVTSESSAGTAEPTVGASPHVLQSSVPSEETEIATPTSPLSTEDSVDAVPSSSSLTSLVIPNTTSSECESHHELDSSFSPNPDSDKKRYPLRSRIRQEEERRKIEEIRDGPKSFTHLPNEIYLKIFSYLPITDVIRLERVSHRFMLSVRKYLILTKRVNFCSGSPFEFLSDNIDDSTLAKILERTPEVTHILGFYPRRIVDRPTPGSISFPGIMHVLRSRTKLKSVEIMNPELLTRIVNHLPNVKFHGMFRNYPNVWDQRYDSCLGGDEFRIPPHSARINMPQNIYNLTKLDLQSVCISCLPRLENVKYLHLKWVRFVGNEPFQNMACPHLQTFIMNNCVGPPRPLKYLRIFTTLARSTNLSRIELVGLRFVNGLMEHIIEDMTNQHRPFQQLQRLVLASNQDVSEVDIGSMILASSLNLYHLALQVNLCRDSVFVSLVASGCRLQKLESIKLGYRDPFQARYSREELVKMGLVEPYDDMYGGCTMTDLGISYLGYLAPNLHHLCIRRGNFLRNPHHWNVSPIDRGTHLEDLTYQADSLPSTAAMYRYLRMLTLEECPVIDPRSLSKFVSKLPQNFETLVCRHMFRGPAKTCEYLGLARQACRPPPASSLPNPSPAAERNELLSAVLGNPGGNHQPGNGNGHNVGNLNQPLAARIVGIGMGPNLGPRPALLQGAMRMFRLYARPQFMFQPPNHIGGGLPLPPVRVDQPLPGSMMGREPVIPPVNQQVATSQLAIVNNSLALTNETSSSFIEPVLDVAAAAAQMTTTATHRTQCRSSRSSRRGRGRSGSCNESIDPEELSSWNFEDDIINSPFLTSDSDPTRLVATLQRRSLEDQAWHSRRVKGSLFTSRGTQTCFCREDPGSGRQLTQHQLELLAHRDPFIVPNILREICTASASSTAPSLGADDSLSVRAASLRVCLCGLVPGALGLLTRVESKTPAQQLEEERLRLIYWTHVIANPFVLSQGMEDQPQEADVVGISAVEPFPTEISDRVYSAQDACVDTRHLTVIAPVHTASADSVLELSGGDRLTPNPATVTSTNPSAGSVLQYPHAPLPPHPPLNTASNGHHLNTLVLENVGLTHVVAQHFPALRYVTVENCSRLQTLCLRGCRRLKRIRISRCPQFSIWNFLWAMTERTEEFRHHAENLSIMFRPFGAYNPMVEKVLWDSRMRSHVMVTHDFRRHVSDCQMDSLTSHFDQVFRDAMYFADYFHKQMDYRRFELAEPSSMDRDESTDCTILKTEATSEWDMKTDIPWIVDSCCTTLNSPTAQEATSLTQADQVFQTYLEHVANVGLEGHKFADRGLHYHVQCKDCHDKWYLPYPYTDAYLRLSEPERDLNVSHYDGTLGSV